MVRSLGTTGIGRVEDDLAERVDEPALERDACAQAAEISSLRSGLAVLISVLILPRSP